MKKKSTLLILSTLMSAALFSCTISDNEPINTEESKTPEEWGYANPAGAFVLNEGQYGKEAGFLTYITYDHKVKQNIYKEINNHALGNTPQDMCFYNGRTYIISQDADDAVKMDIKTDGILTVIDTKTLKKEANYSAELKEIKKSTHVAVIDDHNIIIRDQKGVWRFDRTANKLSFITGSEGTMGKTMVKVNNKVFGANKGKLLAFKANSNQADIAKTFNADITGIALADRNALYVSTKDGAITKLNASNYAVIKQNKLKESEKGLLSSGWGHTSAIAAKGDTIYFNGAKTQIYRHLFNSSTTKMVFDTNDITPVQKQVYQTLAVNPKSGLVYMNTISDWATFKTNRIYEINARGEKGKLLHKYENYTHFPAGVFFAASYR